MLAAWQRKDGLNAEGGLRGPHRTARDRAANALADLERRTFQHLNKDLQLHNGRQKRLERPLAAEHRLPDHLLLAVVVHEGALHDRCPFETGFPFPVELERVLSLDLK